MGRISSELLSVTTISQVAVNEVEKSRFFQSQLKRNVFFR
jgi:hypothetical protein